MELSQPAAEGSRSLTSRPALLAGVCCLALMTMTVSVAPRASDRSGHPGTWYLAAGAAALCAWLAGALLLRHRPTPLAAVLALAAAIQLLPVASPLLFSRDAYSYWAYGRIAIVHERNPYRAAPAVFPRDPAVQAMAPGWRRTTSVYGPLFSFVSEGTAVVGDSPQIAAKLWQLTAALGVLGLAALAALISPAPPFAAALIGWNPLFAVHFGGGGHNDVWMMVLLLGALLAERRNRPRLAGSLWACSVAVKWIPLLLLPLRAAQGRRQAFSWPAFALSAAVLAGGAALLYGAGWLGAVGPAVRAAGIGTRVGAPHLLRSLDLPAALALVAFALAYLGLLAAARRGKARLGLTAGVLLCTTPWLLPWYAVWAVPLAAAEDDTPAVALTTVLTGYLLIAYRL
jgi:alpha-1,6-mannosyltransferase